MQVTYTPIRDDYLQYKIVDAALYIKHLNGTERVDFSAVQDGRMEGDIRFILSAERIEGELNLILFQPVDVEGNPLELNGNFDINEFIDVEVEWKTQKEIEEEKLLESLIPTKEEIEKAELEISAITLLQDLEVI